MRVEIQIKLDKALELQEKLVRRSGATKTPELAALIEDLDALGVAIKPIHPGQTHELLAPFFVVDAPNREVAEEIVSRVKKWDFVEAAYLRPDDALP